MYRVILAIDQETTKEHGKGNIATDFTLLWEKSFGLIRFPVLKMAAKIVLALAMSSAVVERLFNAAGLLLGHFRRLMQPTLVTSSVYFRYGCNIKASELARGWPTRNPLTRIGEQEVERFPE